MHTLSPLKWARFQRGLTQHEVAQLVGCQQWAVSIVERGEHLDGPTFPKLAKFFGIPKARLRRQLLAWRDSAVKTKRVQPLRKTG